MGGEETVDIIAKKSKILKDNISKLVSHVNFCYYFKNVLNN
jgi:hypothetical protein